MRIVARPGTIVPGGQLDDATLGGPLGSGLGRRGSGLWIETSANSRFAVDLARAWPLHQFEGRLYASREFGVGSDMSIAIDGFPFLSTDLGQTGPRYASAADTDVTTGTIYGATGFSDGGRLYTVDPVSGAWTLVADIVGAAGVLGLAFDDTGQMWVIYQTGNNANRFLGTVDKATGALTPVGQVMLAGPTPAQNLESLEILRDGRFVAGTGSALLGTNSALAVIDPATAMVTQIVSLPGVFRELSGLALTADERLLASTGQGEGKIFELFVDRGFAIYLGDAAASAVLALDVLSTDADPVYDVDERTNGTALHLEDTDWDGLTDDVELALGTDGTSDDSDGDTLRDGYENAFSGLDPLLGDNPDADSDGDGLTDGEEQSLRGDPTTGDTDGDGIPDAEEARLGTALDRADSDGDGVPDPDELANGTNPLSRDSDGDGAGDFAELSFAGGALDPNDPDSDDDGIPDGLDVDPLVPTAAPPTPPTRIVSPPPDVLTASPTPTIVVSSEGTDDHDVEIELVPQNVWGATVRLNSADCVNLDDGADVPPFTAGDDIACTVPAPLIDGARYAARARSVDGGGAGPWSTRQRLTFDPAAPVPSPFAAYALASNRAFQTIVGANTAAVGNTLQLFDPAQDGAASTPIQTLDTFSTLPGVVPTGWGTVTIDVDHPDGATLLDVTITDPLGVPLLPTVQSGGQPGLDTLVIDASAIQSNEIRIVFVVGHGSTPTLVRVELTPAAPSVPAVSWPGAAAALAVLGIAGSWWLRARSVRAKA